MLLAKDALRTLRIRSPDAGRAGALINPSHCGFSAWAGEGAVGSQPWVIFNSNHPGSALPPSGEVWCRIQGTRLGGQGSPWGVGVSPSQVQIPELLAFS